MGPARGPALTAHLISVTPGSPVPTDSHAGVKASTREFGRAHDSVHKSRMSDFYLLEFFPDVDLSEVSVCSPFLYNTLTVHTRIFMYCSTSPGVTHARHRWYLLLSPFCF